MVVAVVLGCIVGAGCVTQARHGSPSAQDSAKPSVSGRPVGPVSGQRGSERALVAAATQSYVFAVARSDWHGVCQQLASFAFRQFACYIPDDVIPGPYAHIKPGARGVYVRILGVGRSMATALLTGPDMRGSDGEYTPQRLELGRDVAGHWNVRVVRVPLPSRGVHGDVGERIVGTPYPAILQRYGHPEQTHVSRGELCGTWDTVGDPYDWQFCFRHGVMNSASANQ